MSKTVQTVVVIGFGIVVLGVSTAWAADTGTSPDAVNTESSHANPAPPLKAQQLTTEQSNRFNDALLQFLRDQATVQAASSGKSMGDFVSQLHWVWNRYVGNDFSVKGATAKVYNIGEQISIDMGFGPPQGQSMPTRRGQTVPLVATVQRTHIGTAQLFFLTELRVADLTIPSHSILKNSGTLWKLDASPQAFDLFLAAVTQGLSSDNNERGLACRALSDFGSASWKSVPQLIRQLSNPSIAQAAAAALQKITAQDFGKDARKWAGWWEKNKTPPAQTAPGNH